METMSSRMRANADKAREWFTHEQVGWRAFASWVGLLVGFGVVWGGVYYGLMLVSGLLAGLWFVAMAGVFAALFVADGCGMARGRDTSSGDGQSRA